MKRWQQCLTRKQFAHLVEMQVHGPPTLRTFRDQRAAQAAMKAKDGKEPCWDCRDIERRLQAAGKL